MQINTDAIFSVTEANQDFSRVTKTVEEHGQAILWHPVPKK